MMAFLFRRQATRRLSKHARGPGERHLRLFSFSTRNQRADPVELGSQDSAFRTPKYKGLTLDQPGTKDSRTPVEKKSRSRNYQRSRLPVKPSVGFHSGSSLDILIDGQSQRIASLALRDLCQCPLCIDPSTKQKSFYTPDIPADIEAHTPVYGPESVSFKWTHDVPGYGEDHTTEIPLHTLRKVVTTGRTTTELVLPTRTLWDAQEYSQQTNDFDYDMYMQDDATLFNAVQQLHTHGLLFVKGVPEDEESVVKVAERIGPLKTTFYGKTWDVRSVPEAKNVAYTAQNLGFHMDLMYMKQPPHLQLLHCIRSSSAGGASLFCDSFKAANGIADTDLASFITLSGLRTEFHYDHPDNYYHQSRMVMEQKDVHWGGTLIHGWTHALTLKKMHPENRWLQKLTLLDFLEHVAWSPPFQAPFKLDGDPSQDVDRKLDSTKLSQLYSFKVRKWHAAAQKFNALIHQPEVIYERLMKPGECVIFDNRRVLHARRAFEVGDVGKERWLRGAYIDKDPYMSRMKVLGDRFNNGNVPGAAKNAEESYWDEDVEDKRTAAAS